MIYRREGKKIHEEQSEWSAWLEEHADLAAASGLPEWLLASGRHWHYFLGHGTLCGFEDGTGGFSVDQLSIRQKAALLRLLRTYPGDADGVVPRLITDMIEAVEAKYK